MNEQFILNNKYIELSFYTLGYCVGLLFFIISVITVMNMFMHLIKGYGYQFAQSPHDTQEGWPVANFLYASLVEPKEAGVFSRILLFFALVAWMFIGGFILLLGFMNIKYFSSLFLTK